LDQSEGPDLAAMVEGGKGLHMNGKLILGGKLALSSLLGPGRILMNGKGTWKVRKINDHEIDELPRKVVYDYCSDFKILKLISPRTEVAMKVPLGNICGKITLTYQK